MERAIGETGAIPPKAKALIDALGLIPHPEEGGWFRETWRAADSIAGTALPGRYQGADRSHGTCIYYLLTPETVSALHLLQSDEIFHFYLGDPVEMLQLFPDGTTKMTVLGSDVFGGHVVQHLVPQGVWQGSRLQPGGEVALMGCSVAPGFDFADYTHGDRAALTKAYPKVAEAIAALTRE
ncbi:MAG: cupin domain-containing protein [Rhodospirillaceae bacterium]